MFIWNRVKEQYAANTDDVWRPLNVLIWKHWRGRKHRFWSTLWEIIQGSLVFLVLFLARQSVLLKKGHLDKLEVPRTDNDVYKIFYSPVNNFTDMLMKNVVVELNVNPESGLDVSWELEDTYEFSNFMQSYNGTDNNVVFVEFKKTQGNSSDFTYTLKMFNDDRSNEYEEIYDGFFRGILPPEEVASSYLGMVQWAIDKSYIQQLEDHEIPQELEFREKKEYISTDLANLQKFIILCTVVAPLPFFMCKSSDFVERKRSGLQAMIRLAGVPPNIFRVSHIIDTAMIGAVHSIIITILLKISSNPILPYSNGLLITITLVLYFLNITALAFVTSTLSYDYNHANSIAMLIYLCTFILDFAWHSQEITGQGMRTIMCCVLPHAPIYLFWDKVTNLEALGQGVTIWNIGKRRVNEYLSILHLWFFLCVQLFILMTVEWYLDLVSPGEYGIPVKWNFIFKRKFLFPKKKKKVNFHVTAEQNIRVLRDDRYFEPGPINAEIAIKITNVTKAC